MLTYGDTNRVYVLIAVSTYHLVYTVNFFNLTMQIKDLVSKNFVDYYRLKHFRTWSVILIFLILYKLVNLFEVSDI